MKTFTQILRYACAIMVLAALPASAQVLGTNTTSGLPPATTTTEEPQPVEIKAPTSPFAFGIEAGATIDFGGTDSGCYDIDIFGGYRKGVVQLAGLGIGLHPSFNHGRRFIPIYAIFRCNFKEGRSLCFADIKAGMSINDLNKKTNNTGAYASAGIGFNLYQNRRLKTYAIIGYSFTQIVPFDSYTEKAIHGATVRIGISF